MLGMKGVRVRLEIGTEFGLPVEKQRTWLLLPPTLKDVNDLVCLIAGKYKLAGDEAGNVEEDVVLVVDGFVMPADDDIGVIRDNDLVQLRKKERWSGGHQLKGKRQQLSTDGANGRKKRRMQARRGHEGFEQEDGANDGPQSKAPIPQSNSNGNDAESSSSSEEEDGGKPNGVPLAQDVTQAPSSKSQPDAESDEESSSSPASSSSSSSSSESEEEPEESSKQLERPTTSAASPALSQSPAPAKPSPSPAPPADQTPVTPSKGHVRFTADGATEHVASQSPSAAPITPSPNWAPRGRGRGRGGSLPPPEGPPASSAFPAFPASNISPRGRGRGRARGARGRGDHSGPPFPSFPSNAEEGSPGKDYSTFPPLPVGQSPKAGDVLAYTILEIRPEGPRVSAYKEATVVWYDTATSVVTLRPRNLVSVPLDGAFISNEAERQGLMNAEVPVPLAFMGNVKLVQPTSS